MLAEASVRGYPPGNMMNQLVCKYITNSLNRLGAK